MAEVEWISRHCAEKICDLDHGENLTFRESTQDRVVHGERLLTASKCIRLEFDACKVVSERTAFE